VSNLITDWRVAVQEHLATSFPDADVRGGEEISVNRRDKALICVWWPGWSAIPRDISLANPTLMIRYFPKRSKQPQTETPVDQSALEQAAVDLMVAMESKRKAGDFVENLACYLKDVVPNPAADRWCVNAIVQAYTLNLAASAA
jgi:hypothetical protein